VRVDKHRVWELEYHMAERANPNVVVPDSNAITTVSNTSDLYYGYLSLRMDGSTTVKLPATATEMDKVVEAFENFNDWMRTGNPIVFRVHRIRIKEVLEDRPKFPNWPRRKMPIEFTEQAEIAGLVRYVEKPQVEPGAVTDEAKWYKIHYEARNL
jgi:hypothetical protein